MQKKETKANWQTKKLGEVCEELFAGGDVPKLNLSRFETDVLNIPIFSNGEKNKGLYGFTNLARVTKPSITVSARGTIGYSEIRNVPFYPAVRLIVVIPKLNILDLSYLKFVIDNIDFVHNGTSIPQLTVPMIYEYPITFPSLPEQQRIVKILDDVFGKITLAKENTEKNLQNSKELFDNYLYRIFTNNSKGWEFKKLSEVAEYFNGLTYSPKDVSDKGIIVLRSSNIQNDELDFSDIVRVNKIVKDRIIVNDEDILMCSRNGSKRLVGKTATISNLKEKMTFGTFMMIVRSNQNSYLKWFFKSNEFRRQITSGGNTMINQITRYMLDDVIISFPPQEKQKSIVAKLDALSAQTKKLEENYKKKLENLEELKKSVLKQAFEGKL